MIDLREHGIGGGGGTKPTGTAQPSDVRFGSTFMNAEGKELTGTLVKRIGGTVTPTTANIFKNAGIYDEDIVIKGDVNLIPANIKKGVKLFNVDGELSGGIQIKKIQRGVATIRNSKYIDVTLGNFNIDKSIVKVSSRGWGQSLEANLLLCRGQIADSTTIRLQRGASGGNETRVWWEVIEYDDSVKVSRGLTNINSGSATTSAFTAGMDLNKCSLDYSYCIDGDIMTPFAGFDLVAGYLVNGTNQIVFERYGGNNTVTCCWYVIEY